MRNDTRRDIFQPKQTLRGMAHFFTASPGFFGGDAGGAGGGGGGAGSKWDSAFLAPGIVLTDGGRTAGATSGTGSRSFLAGPARSTGKLYFEILTAPTFATGSNTNVYFGVANEGISLTTQPCFNQLGAPYYSLRGNGQRGGDQALNGAVVTTGLVNGVNVVGIAVDLDARTVAFYVGNVLRVTASFGAAASMRPMGTVGAAGASLYETIALNAGEQNFAPPAGFTAWGSA